MEQYNHAQDELLRPNHSQVCGGVLSNTTISASERSGFTLIELLLVLGILAILGGLVITALNPQERFADARNKQREAHVNTIANAIGERVADHRGAFDCTTAGEIPTTTTVMATGGYHIAPCLVPTYLPRLPFDPSADGAYFASITDYNSKYEIAKNATTGRVTVSAPHAELGEVISVTR